LSILAYSVVVKDAISFIQNLLGAPVEVENLRILTPVSLIYVLTPVNLACSTIDNIFYFLFATEFPKQNDLMRFFKGSKVEVLQEAEVPFGSWRPGEIISGNGHTYLVRYDESPVDSSVAVERVPRRLMRPRPPADDPVRWSLGTILEAFDSYSWKVAEVVRVLGKNQYLVRLLGSSLELSAHASDLRLRKLWLDDRWVVTQKVMLCSFNSQTTLDYFIIRRSIERCFYLYTLAQSSS